MFRGVLSGCNFIFRSDLKRLAKFKPERKLSKYLFPHPQRQKVEKQRLMPIGRLFRIHTSGFAQPDYWLSTMSPPRQVAKNGQSKSKFLK